MFDEDFKLSKMNKIMIGITIVSLIALIIVAIMLVISFKTPQNELPDLLVTSGRTSTRSPRTTTTTTTTTTTSTTSRPLKSPYYDVKVDDLLTDEAFTKNKLNRSEAEVVATELYKVITSFYNISDNSLLNIDLIVKHAKKNEKDLITVDGNKYGQIYNYDALVGKVIASNYLYIVRNVKYEETPVFVEKNGRHYRLENKFGDVYPVFLSVDVKDISIYQINCEIRYYMSNYLETGATSPVYKTSKMTLAFDEGRWKVSSYNFPLYK